MTGERRFCCGCCCCCWRRCYSAGGVCRLRRDVRQLFDADPISPRLAVESAASQRYRPRRWPGQPTDCACRRAFITRVPPGALRPRLQQQQQPHQQPQQPQQREVSARCELQCIDNDVLSCTSSCVPATAAALNTPPLSAHHLPTLPTPPRDLIPSSIQLYGRDYTVVG